jgi:hypothetical protein
MLTRLTEKATHDCNRISRAETCRPSVTAAITEYPACAIQNEQPAALSLWRSTIVTGGLSKNKRMEPRSDSVHEAQSAPSIALPAPLAGVVRQLAIGCACASLLSGLLLLMQDVAPGLIAFVRHRWLAASALVLAGTACFGLVSSVRARARDVIMRLSLGSAFILWGIQQLLPESGVSALLGDIVIVLFVVDFSAFIDTTLQARTRTPADGNGLKPRSK